MKFKHFFFLFFSLLLFFKCSAQKRNSISVSTSISGIDFIFYYPKRDSIIDFRRINSVKLPLYISRNVIKLYQAYSIQRDLYGRAAEILQYIDEDTGCVSDTLNFHIAVSAYYKLQKKQ